MTSQVEMFGHDFGPRRMGIPYCPFKREFHPLALSALPRTYAQKTGNVEVRVLDERGPLSLFDVGHDGISRLQWLRIAEISVTDTIEPHYAERALRLLSNNYDLLMGARRSDTDVSGIGGILIADLWKSASLMTSLIETAAAHFSDRFDSQCGLIISQYDREPGICRWQSLRISARESTDLRTHPLALDLSDPKVINLFGKLRLKVPDSVYPALSVAQFNLIRIFPDGASYANIIHIPFEFLTAEPA